MFGLGLGAEAGNNVYQSNKDHRALIKFFACSQVAKVASNGNSEHQFGGFLYCGTELYNGVKD